MSYLYVIKMVKQSMQRRVCLKLLDQVESLGYFRHINAFQEINRSHKYEMSLLAIMSLY